MGKQVERCRLEQCGLSNRVRRLPGVEGSVARARVGAHWALKNLIIEKIYVAAKVTLDGAAGFMTSCRRSYSEINKKSRRWNVRTCLAQCA